MGVNEGNQCEVFLKKFGSEWKSRNVYILRRFDSCILLEGYTFSVIGLIVLKSFLNQDSMIFFPFSLISPMTS